MKIATTRLALSAILLMGLGVFSSSATGTTSKHKASGKSSTGHAASSSKSTSGSTKSAGAHRTRTSKASGSKTRGKKRDAGQKAPTADRISEIQQALSKSGNYSGTPNGKWDDSTVAGMRNFQSAHGLNPSGKLDAKTLQQLGLGSQTAGVAAPVPTASSTGRGAAGVSTQALRNPNR